MNVGSEPFNVREDERKPFRSELSTEEESKFPLDGMVE